MSYILVEERELHEAILIPVGGAILKLQSWVRGINAGCALPADRASAQGCCLLQSWPPLSPLSHSHQLTLHLLPEGSTPRSCRPWPGLGLLGAPQVGTVTELASLRSRTLAAKPAGPLALVSP